MSNRFRELIEEFQLVLVGRNNLLDSIIPPLGFVLVNTFFGLTYAIASSLIIAGAIVLIRFQRHQLLWNALGGIAGVAIAIAFALWFGKAQGFFVPGLITGLVTVVVCMVSVLVRRPMVAWTSFLARGWTLEWYWHPRVRPAYDEVTIGWAIFFALRLWIQFDSFEREDTLLLAASNILLNWPALIVLLAISYLYGVWRLQKLHGPSVQEFTDHGEPPWTSQRRGF